MAIPASWKPTELGEILLSIIGGGTPSKSNPSFYEGDIPWMSVKDMNKNILNDTVDHISEEAVEKSSTNVIPSGTPIIATRMSLGKIVVANFDSAINQDLKALFPATGINRDYLIGWYRSISRKIEELGTGTTVKGIRLEVLKSLDFPVPPLAEQKIIADKLDILMAQVETTKARLERTPQILKTFRQSVLADAVSGKLTETWRAEKQLENISFLVNEVNSKKEGKLKVRIKQGWDGKISLYNLPDSWAWISNYKLAQDSRTAICAGPFGTIFKAKDFRDEGVPIIFLRHVKENGFNQNKPNFMDVAVWEEYHQEYSVFGGELLVTKLGDPPGESCIYPSDIGTAMVTPDVLKMSVDNEVADTNYLMHFFNSPIAKKMVGDLAFGSTRLRIDIAMFKSFPIPLPPREEQTKIVRRVEELFAFADSIEEKANAALERVNNLTQSILAKAFRGELTAEWRTANPELISGENSAEALLEKIKAEREVLKSQPKRTVVKRHVGKRMSKEIITVVEALKEAGKALSGQQLLAAAGYPSDSTTEQLEQFFLDIRDSLVIKKSITKLERGDDEQDWFTVADTTAHE